MNYGTWMLARREIARYMNVWGQTIVPPVVTAALFLFVFGHALGERIQQFDGVPYLAFIAPGLLVQGAITNAYNNTSSSLFDARRARYIEDILSSPLTDARIVVAYMASGTSRGLLVGGLTLAIAWPVASWNVDVPLFLLLLLLSCSALALTGLLGGIHASRWDHIIVPVTFILTPLTFLGGVFYPVTALAPALETASRFNPIYYIVDGHRQALLGVGDTNAWLTVAGLVLLNVGLFAWANHAFRHSPRLRA